MNQMVSPLEMELATAYRARQAKYAAAVVPQTKEEIARKHASSMAKQMATFKEKWAATQERQRQDGLRAKESLLLLAKQAAEEGRHEALRRLQCPSVRKILSAVSDAFSVSTADILSDRRSRGSLDKKTADIVTPRQVVMYLSRVLTPLSLPQIAKCINRDHTTLISGARKIQNMMDADPVFRAKVEALREEIAPTQGGM